MIVRCLRSSHSLIIAQNKSGNILWYTANKTWTLRVFRFEREKRDRNTPHQLHADEVYSIESFYRPGLNDLPDLLLIGKKFFRQHVILVSRPLSLDDDLIGDHSRPPLHDIDPV